MIIHLLNRQKLFIPRAARLKALAGFFAGKSSADGAQGWHELSLLLTDDSGIRQINRQFLERDDVTDVISFSLQPPPAKGKLRTAEIVVNVEQACREGEKRRGMEHELALYLAHGCDHLAGHNDRTLSGRKKMRRRELRWLKDAAGLNLLSDLFRPSLPARAKKHEPG